MPEFNMGLLMESLRRIPERRSIFEPEEYSEYLQKEVFDPLIESGTIDIKEVDFSKFELRHVTPKSYADSFQNVNEGWARGFNEFVKRTPAAACAEPAFF